MRRNGSHLALGLFDSFSNFLNSRQGDFIKLDETDKEFGPGPLVVLYNVPPGIDDDEIYDMISDGAPTAFQRKCRVFRSCDDDNELLDLPLEKILEKIAQGGLPRPMMTIAGATTVPVILFSGFNNEEMMTTYNLLGQEIYQETAGQMTPACAKVVPNAMQKPLRQVLDEIAGDHQDAIRLESE